MVTYYVGYHPPPDQARPRLFLFLFCNHVHWHQIYTRMCKNAPAYTVYGGWGSNAPSGCVTVPLGTEWIDTPAGPCGPSHHIFTCRFPPVLPHAGDVPTDKGSTQAKLSGYAHAPKTHTNTRQ